MGYLVYCNDTATTEIYTLSLHDALPISPQDRKRNWVLVDAEGQTLGRLATQIADTLRGKRKPTYTPQDRKSTRLNSSHANISYAVFCLKKKYHHCSCRVDASCCSALRYH